MEPENDQPEVVTDVFDDWLFFPIEEGGEFELLEPLLDDDFFMLYDEITRFPFFEEFDL
jgi:hypothetical protein